MTTGFVMGKNKTVLTMKYVLFILLALMSIGEREAAGICFGFCRR